ncbi:hypothetical protein WJX84_000874 [Apatococcus fuscideae]|uniref:Uncharacterized protein n=1 Tax=Apatococcus fuscideae TaxID=2026836 RepID=A0AAW1SX61_9CHLO
MIWIDFFWSTTHRDDWKNWCEENGGEDDEPECRVGYLERGAGVMDFYFRLLCVAAYRKVCHSSEKYENFSNFSKTY